MNLLGWGDLYTKTLCKLYKLGGQPARNGQLFKKNDAKKQRSTARWSGSVFVGWWQFICHRIFAFTNSLWVSPSRNWWWHLSDFYPISGAMLSDSQVAKYGSSMQRLKKIRGHVSHVRYVANLINCWLDTKKDFLSAIQASHPQIWRRISSVDRTWQWWFSH